MPHSDFEKSSPEGAKIASHSKEATHSKILVLCIDRDDDIGSKGGIETPIVGRDACINAGTRLAIEDPEDADSNAIFGAVKTYEELVSKGYTAEVAVVAGKFNRGVEADEKISLEVKSILEKYHADGAVIVSDGEDDETVMPVIQSRVPVISVQRVIIRHSRSVEYSYAVLGRYLKMLVYDSQYSKFFLGVPGVLLAAGALAVIFDAGKWITAIILAILGGAFIVRAFDIDKTLSSFGRLTPTSFIKIFSIIAGVLMILAAIANGISSIPTNMHRESMSALLPSSTALATSVTSARVGSGLDTIETSIWVAVMMGRPARLAARIRRFCEAGTRSIGFTQASASRRTEGASDARHGARLRPLGPGHRQLGGLHPVRLQLLQAGESA